VRSWLSSGFLAGSQIASSQSALLLSYQAKVEVCGREIRCLLCGGLKNPRQLYSGRLPLRLGSLPKGIPVSPEEL